MPLIAHAHAVGNTSYVGDSWSPAELFPSEGVWYDPSVVSSVWKEDTRMTPAVADDAVGAIDDLSGNGHHLLQVTASKRPILRNASGLWYLDFDGTDDRMDTASNPFGATLSNGWAGMAWREVTRQNSQGFNLSGDFATAAKVWFANLPWSDGKIYFDVGGQNAPNRIFGTNTVSVGTDAVFVFGCSDADDTQFIDIDGVELVSDATGHSVSTTAGLNIGGGTVCHPRVYAFIARSPILTAEESASALTYLAATQGRTL